MITFDRNHVKYGELMTQRAIDGFLVVYETPAKGKIRAHLMQAVRGGEDMEDWHYPEALSSASTTFDDKEFDGKDILDALHDYYIPILQGYNENIEFEKEL